MKALLLLLALPLFAPPCRAGAFDPRIVPADARWVAHVDFEALARSLLWSTLRENGHDMALEFDFDHIEREFGVDPLADLSSLTFYDAGAGLMDFVAVLRARSSVDVAFSRLAERAKPAGRIGERNLYPLSLAHVELVATLIPGPTSAERTIVLGRSVEAITRAIALLDGSAPSLAGARAPALSARPAAGALFFATGSRAARRSLFFGAAMGLLRELAALERAQAAVVEERAQGLTFEIGEERETLFTRLEIDGETAQAASEMRQVLRDSLARLTKAALGTDAAPRVERIARALGIEASGTRMSTVFRYDIRGFVEDVLRSEEALGIGATPR